MQQGRNQASGFVRTDHPLKENPLHELPRLLAAALGEFSERSFDEASLNDIIRRSGMNKGSFYYRFRDKMDLYLCLIDLIAQEKLAYLRQIQRRSALPADFFELIRDLAEAGLEFALKQPRYHALWQRHLADSAEVKRQVRQAFPQGGANGLRALVEEACQEGQFAPAFSADFVLAIIQTLLDNFDSLVWPEMSSEDLLLQVDRLIQMLKYGLAAQQ